MKFKHQRLNSAILSAKKGFSITAGAIKSWLLTGVIMLAPTALTLYIIYWIFTFSDGILGGTITELTGLQIPGIGLIIPVAACLIMGAVAQNYVGKKIIKALDSGMMKMPVIKSLYTGIKQVANVIMQQNKSDFKRVVMIEYPKDDCWVLGFVTADFCYEVKDDRVPKNLVSVFMPTTPNPTSGYLLMLSKEKIVDIDIDIELAMKIIISGGLVQATHDKDKETSEAAAKALNTVGAINEQSDPQQIPESAK